MKNIILKSKTRDAVGSGLNRFRKQGLVPGVVYGHKVNPENLWVDMKEFSKTYAQVGESAIIELEIEGKNKASVLIHDIQNDPLTEKITHVDFFQVNMDEKIETEVPLEFFGDAPAVKEAGGILIKSINAISVSCLPANLPSKIIVDISSLKTFTDRISVENLDIPAGVKVLADAGAIVVSVAPPRSDEELAKLDEKVEEDVTKVEGVVKETPEEEGAEGKKAEEKTEGAKKE